MLAWLQNNWAVLGDLTLEHARLAGIPIIAGFVISVPLGWLAAKNNAMRGFLLSVGNVAYTIPSLALFVTLPAILGTRVLDEANVVVALMIYAVAIMVRSAADAFGAVDPQVLDAATAMGTTAWQRFLRVELPLSGPVLLAGIRVVSVSTVSLVSVGALIGSGGLGHLFTDGFQRNYPEQILVGMVAIVLLALVFDLTLAGLGRLSMPWRRTLRPIGVPRRDRALAAA